MKRRVRNLIYQRGLHNLSVVRPDDTISFALSALNYTNIAPKYSSQENLEVL